MIRLGESFKEALMRQWPQCCSFVAAAAVFEKRARSALCQCAAEEAPMLQEQKKNLLQHKPKNTTKETLSHYRRPLAPTARPSVDSRESLDSRGLPKLARDDRQSRSGTQNWR